MANLHKCLLALADPTRRGIFESLSRRPAAVTDLARGSTVSRPAVSQHLKALKLAGLVRMRVEGSRHVYHVDLDGLRPARNYFQGFWDKALASLKVEAEKQGKPS